MLNTNTAKAVQILRTMQLIDDDAKGVLILKDCVLIENYTGKTFAYTFYNYNTGEKKYIGHCKQPADEAALNKVLPKLMEQVILGTTIPEGADLIRYIFENVFSSYGYAVRVQQIDLSVKMYRAMREREILLSDVAVGFGKTHAYLVAGIVYHLETQTKRKPIIVSTSSKELQRAIMEEYLPEISKMLLEHGIIDRNISAILRKGKHNYICHKRLATYLNRLKTDKKNQNQYEALKRIRDHKEIDLDKAYGISRYDRNRICVNDTVCKECSAVTCPYKTYMQKALKDVFVLQICNHNYYTMDAKNKSVGRKPLLPDHKAVIIDEAHKLDQAAVQTYRTLVDFDQIEAFVKDRSAKDTNSKQNKRIFSLCKEIEKTCWEIKKSLYAQVDFLEDTSKYSVKISNNVRGKLRNLGTSLLLANRMLVKNKNFSLQQLRYIAKSISRLLETDCITYIEKVGRRYVLVGVPKEINTLIKRDLFSGDCGIVLTSGTLAIDNDFEYIKGLLGLNRTARKMSYVVKPSPFNYMDKSLIYTSDRTIYPNYENELYIKSLANEIDILVKASCGHSLVLFTSYTAMRAVYELLRKREYPFSIFKTSKGNGHALSQFKKSKNAVLFGCGAMWEGMNFEGDILSHLIITKLPFLIPDPITEHKRIELNNDDEYRQQILLPQMLLKLKQGHGRAIRTNSDTAVISILDCRVNKSYMKPVMNALPKCKYTSEIEDIKRFFREKKSDEYFGRDEHDSTAFS